MCDQADDQSDRMSSAAQSGCADQRMSTKRHTDRFVLSAGQYASVIEYGTLQKSDDEQSAVAERSGGRRTGRQASEIGRSNSDTLSYRERANRDTEINERTTNQAEHRGVRFQARPGRHGQIDWSKPIVQVLYVRSERTQES